MKITSITLYKTPLDDSYRNVFDFGSYETTGNIYKQFLDLTFPKKLISLTSVKSVKVTNGNCAFTLFAEYAEMREYNYVCINSNSFYFITDYVSQNDGNRASVGIILKWDAWANNLSALSDAGNFDTNVIERRHTERFYSDNSGNAVRQYNTVAEGDSPNHIVKDISSVNMVLWQAFRFDSDVLIKNSSDSLFRYKGLIGTQAEKTPVTFNPVFTYNTRTKTLTRISKVNGEIKNYADIYSSTLKSSHILSSWFTFLAPIQAVVTADGEITINNSVLTSVYLYATEGSSQVQIGGTSDKFMSVQDGIEWWKNQPYPTDVYFRRTKGSIAPAITTDYFARNIPAVRNAESKLYTYPYNYTKFKIRDKEHINVNTDRYEDFEVILDARDKTTPILRFTEFGNTDNTPVYVPIPSQNIISVDQLDLFNRNNGESAYTNLGLGIVSKVLTGTSTGNAGMIASGATDLIGFYANQTDLKNRQDNYSVPSFIASDDIQYQDFPFILSCEMYDEAEIQTITTRWHRYGYKINKRGSVRENTRIDFDYVKTIDCNLPFITNIRDKDDIESAYDNGITRWHINKKDGVIVCNSSMNFALNNPERAFVGSIVTPKLTTPSNLKITRNWQ